VSSSLEPAVFPAVIDSCVLYHLELRLLLIHLDAAGLFRLHVSEKIVDDFIRNLAKKKCWNNEKALHLKSKILAVVENGIIDGSEIPLDNLQCNYNDRHVLATAIRAKAEEIVTFNLQHFPPETTEPHGVRAVHPDRFVCNLYDLRTEVFIACLQQMSINTASPHLSVGKIVAGRL